MLLCIKKYVLKINRISTVYKNRSSLIHDSSLIYMHLLICVYKIIPVLFPRLLCIKIACIL